MDVIIRNIPELIDLIEKRNLRSDQICMILKEGFKIFANEENTPQELIQELKEWDLKYGKTPGEKPLFLDPSLKGIIGHFIKWETPKEEM